MTLWLFLVIVIGGLLLFGAVCEIVSRRRTSKRQTTPGQYDQVYMEQVLQDTRDRINEGRE